MNKNLLKKVIFVALWAFTLFMIASPVFATMPQDPESLVCYSVPEQDNATIYLLARTSLIVFIYFLFLVFMSFKISKKSIKQSTSKENKEKQELAQNKDQKIIKTFRTISFIIWLILTWCLITFYYYDINNFKYSGGLAVQYACYALLIVPMIWIIKLIITRKVTKTDILCLCLSALALITLPLKTYAYSSPIPFINFIMHFFKNTIEYIAWLIKI